jgi:NADH-quinone oxidoreductase subunit N
MKYRDLIWLASPEIVLALTALATLALGLARGRVRGLCTGVAAAGLFFAMASVLLLPVRATLFHGMLVVSPLNSFFQLVCLLLVLATLLIPGNERSLGDHGEYLAVLLLATIGLLLLIGSEEFLMLFIGLELTGLALYVLTAFNKRSYRSAEAGLKYFLFGSVASAFTLFGISLIYGMTGTTTLAAVATRIGAVPMPYLLAAGMAMTLIGFAFKIAAAPFHFWVGDTYEAAPIPSAAFIASGSKVAAFVALGKIVLFGFAPAAGSAAWHAFVAGWIPIVALLSAFSILLGNLLALVQTNVRRLLGYSAVAHGGYTLLGLMAGREGFAATLFYTTIYAFTLVGAFGIVGLVRQRTGGESLADFAGLRARSPLLAGCMAVFLLSLGGLPPLAGFFGKFYLFSVAMRAAPQRGLTWLVALALFGSLISLYYYLIVLRVIFGESPNPALAANQSATPLASFPLLSKVSAGVLAAGILLIGIFPESLVRSIIASLR